MGAEEPRGKDPEPYVLGIDMGTSSTRAFLFDAAGRRGDGAKVPYRWHTTPDGGAEIDPDRIVAATAEAIDAALATAGSRGARIAAVGVAALWHSVLGTDAEGVPTTPLYSWSDVRASAAAIALRDRLDPRRAHARTGALLQPSYLPARLLWLSGAEPQRFARTRWWMSAGEYLGLRLFGERRVSLSMASGTGLFAQNAAVWDDEILDAIPVDADCLSPIVDLDEPYRGLREEWAHRWPPLADIPWLPAVGDGACANLGSGCLGASDVGLTVGTSGAVRVLFRAAEVEIPWGLWCYRLDREHFVIGGASSNGGNVYRWLRDALRLDQGAPFEAALSAIPPDGHGLTILPFLAGERGVDATTPVTGAMVGLTLHTTPAHIARAALEAVAYRLAGIRDRLATRFPDVQRIVVSGSALRSAPVWLRIVADVFGEPVTLSADPEASARGAALLALRAIGALESIESAPDPGGQTLHPAPDAHARYRAAMQRQRALERLLIKVPERGD